MEVNNFEVEEELSTMATVAWAEEVWLGKWWKEYQKAWRIFQVQTWRQERERGSAGAVMCETRDLGITWPQWHTLLFGGAGGGGQERGLPAGCEKVVPEASQDGLVEGMGSKARM